MKNLRTVLFIIMLMLLAVCLTSCSGIDRAFMSDEPDTSNNIAGVYEAKDIVGGAVDTVKGDLVYLTSASENMKTHTVYNLSTGSKVYSLTTMDGEIFLVSVRVEGEEIGLFVSYDYDAKKTKLYSGKGELVATLETDSYFETEADLIRFGEKCYRADKDGNIAFAFDYPSISKFPEGLEKYEDYYYNYVNKSICVYDDELNFVSKYSVPTYGENVFYTVLENGNALVQYTYPCPTDSNDYDVVLGDEKHQLVTELFRIKSGKVKHLNCNYLFRYANNLLMAPEESEKSGIDPSVFPVMGEAYRIENKQVDRSSLLIYITNRGKVKEFDTVNGSSVTSVTRLDTNRFIVGTKGNRYLMNEKGHILGDITNSTVYGRYLTNSNDWNIYNSDLKSVYSYGDKSYSVRQALGDNLILQSHLYGQSNVIFTGSSEVKPFPGDSMELCLTEKAFYVCKDKKINGLYSIYDHNGELVKTVAGKFNPYAVAKTDDAILLRCDANYMTNGNYYLVKFEK